MEETKTKLTKALKMEPFGAIAMADLTSYYRKTHKEKLDFKGLGFESLQQLLEAMPDTVQVKYDRKISDFRVFLVNYEVSEAIEREINYKGEMASSADACDSKRCYDNKGTSEDATTGNRLRQKPIPTAFRGLNDWDLYLNGFPNETKESDLMDVFKEFRCTRIRVKKRENGTLYGFATFREYDDAEMAYVTLDGKEFRGRNLVINFAKSSIASEGEVRTRLEKTQFTAEVNSSRHRKFSADGGSVDRKATGQPYDVNLRRTECQRNPFHPSPFEEDDSPWLTWQRLSASGYPRTEDERTAHHKAGTAAHPHGNRTASDHQNQFALEETSSSDGCNSSDKAEMPCDRRRRVQSSATRIVSLFADIDNDMKHSNLGKTAEATVEIESPPCTSESLANPNSVRIVQMFPDEEFDRKQSNSIEATRAIAKATHGGEDGMEQSASFSREDTPMQLHSSRNGEFPNDSQEIRSRNEVQNKTKTLVLNRESVKGVSEHTRDGKDTENCSLFNTVPISDTYLSKAKSHSSISDENHDARKGKTKVNLEVHVDGSIDSENSSYSQKSCSDYRPTDSNKRSEENTPILLQVRKTAFNNASRWLRVYVRDEIMLAEDLLEWTKVYSRIELHLGQVKFQCRNLTQFRTSSFSEISSASNIACSMKSQTEPASSESLVVEAVVPSLSTGRVTQVHSILETCCENNPETMDVQFLQRMLKETQLRQGFLPQGVLPDELVLIVTYVCDSKHFWGSVLNVEESKDDAEDHLQMIDDIARRAGPEFQLDKARTDDRRAGVMYQDTDWCRVWIRTRVSESEVEVFYVDYGNCERRSTDDLWVLPRKCWNLRPMVLPFHLTGTLAQRTLSEMINTKIIVKLVRSQPTDFVVTVRPYKELDSMDID